MRETEKIIKSSKYIVLLGCACFVIYLSIILVSYFSALAPHLTNVQDARDRLQVSRSSHHYRFAAYCAMRAQDTASSDVKTSHLYSVALEAEINLLHRLSS